MIDRTGTDGMLQRHGLTPPACWLATLLWTATSMAADRIRLDASMLPRDVYAIWRPTANSTEASDFRLVVPNASTATLTTLEPGSTTGQAAPPAVQDGRVTLRVSEQPAFVTVP